MDRFNRNPLLRRLVYSSKSKGSALLIIAWALPSGPVRQLSCVVAVDVVAMIVVLWLPLKLALSSFALLVLAAKSLGAELSLCARRVVVAPTCTHAHHARRSSVSRTVF